MFFNIKNTKTNAAEDIEHKDIAVGAFIKLKNMFIFLITIRWGMFLCLRKMKSARQTL